MNKLSKQQVKTIEKVKTMMYLDHKKSLDSHEDKLSRAWLMLHKLLIAGGAYPFNAKG
jgi:hypothetical protein